MTIVSATVRCGVAQAHRIIPSSVDKAADGGTNLDVELAK